MATLACDVFNSSNQHSFSSRSPVGQHRLVQAVQLFRSMSEVVLSIDDEDEHKEGAGARQPKVKEHDEQWALATIAELRDKMRHRRLHMPKHIQRDSASRHASFAAHHHLTRDVISGGRYNHRHDDSYEGGCGSGGNSGSSRPSHRPRHTPRPPEPPLRLHQLPLKPSAFHQAWEEGTGLAAVAGAEERGLARALEYGHSSKATRATGAGAREELGCGWPGGGHAAEAQRWNRLALACTLGAAALFAAAADEWSAPCCDERVSSEAAARAPCSSGGLPACSSARGAGERLVSWAIVLLALAALLAWLASPSRALPCCCTLRELGSRAKRSAASLSEAAVSAALSEERAATMRRDEPVQGGAEDARGVQQYSPHEQLRSALTTGQPVQLHVLLLPVPEDEGYVCSSCHRNATDGSGGCCHHGSLASCCVGLFCCCPCTCCQKPNLPLQLAEVALPPLLPTTAKEGAAASAAAADCRSRPLSRWVRPAVAAEEVNRRAEGSKRGARRAGCSIASAAGLRDLPMLRTGASGTKGACDGQQHDTGTGTAATAPLASRPGQDPHFVLLHPRGRTSASGGSQLRPVAAAAWPSLELRVGAAARSEALCGCCRDKPAAALQTRSNCDHSEQFRAVVSAEELHTAFVEDAPPTGPRAWVHLRGSALSAATSVSCDGGGGGGSGRGGNCSSNAIKASSWGVGEDLSFAVADERGCIGSRLLVSSEEGDGGCAPVAVHRKCRIELSVATVAGKCARGRRDSWALELHVCAVLPPLESPSPLPTEAASLADGNDGGGSGRTEGVIAEEGGRPSVPLTVPANAPATLPTEATVVAKAAELPLRTDMLRPCFQLDGSSGGVGGGGGGVGGDNGAIKECRVAFGPPFFFTSEPLAPCRTQLLHMFHSDQVAQNTTSAAAAAPIAAADPADPAVTEGGSGLAASPALGISPTGIINVDQCEVERAASEVIQRSWRCCSARVTRTLRARAKMEEQAERQTRTLLAEKVAAAVAEVATAAVVTQQKAAAAKEAAVAAAPAEQKEADTVQEEAAAAAIAAAAVVMTNLAVAPAPSPAPPAAVDDKSSQSGESSSDDESAPVSAEATEAAPPNEAGGT